MKTRALVAALLILGFGAEAYAQGESWFGIAYDVSVPTGNTAEFTEGTSFRGVKIGARRALKPNVMIGFMAGWQVFNDETDEVVNLGRADIQGDQFRYTNSFPLMGSLFYSVGGPGARVRPYLGVNAGTYFIERRVEIGTVAITEDAWHWGVAPEVGIGFPVGWHARGFVSATYNWAASSGTAPEQTYWDFAIGMAWQ